MADNPNPDLDLPEIETPAAKPKPKRKGIKRRIFLAGSALVVGGGVLFGPWIGVLTVLSGEALGLALNWRLCRGVLRPRVQRWLARQRRGRRLRRLLQRPASLRLILLLRLAAIPMNLVNAACALGPTPLRSYGLASLILVPRFTLMVLA